MKDEFRSTTQSGSTRRLRQLAQAALAQYCLPGTETRLLAREQTLLFQVDIDPQSTAVHPYLGRIAGKRFVLRVETAGGRSGQEALQEIRWLMALCRDTELMLPEAVPACDGSLVVEIELPGEPGMLVCTLLRWTGTQNLRPWSGQQDLLQQPPVPSVGGADADMAGGTELGFCGLESMPGDVLEKLVEV